MIAAILAEIVAIDIFGSCGAAAFAKEIIRTNTAGRYPVRGSESPLCFGKVPQNAPLRLIHAANRGENFVAILINNSTYGMTGGQMAPTTMIGQASTTTPGGRQAEREGYPMHMCEIIDQLTAPRFIARYSLDKPAEIRKAKAGIRHAFDIQRAHKGYSFVELMSNCPTNWGLSPLQSLEFMREKTLKEFPLGVFRDLEKEETL